MSYCKWTENGAWCERVKRSRVRRGYVDSTKVMHISSQGTACSVRGVLRMLQSGSASDVLVESSMFCVYLGSRRASCRPLCARSLGATVVGRRKSGQVKALDRRTALMTHRCGIYAVALVSWSAGVQHTASCA
jgi:hypothetical protein